MLLERFSSTNSKLTLKRRFYELFLSKVFKNIFGLLGVEKMLRE